MDATVECIKIHEATDKCHFYETTKSCHNDDGKLDYMYFIFCHMPHQNHWIGITLCIIWLLVLFIGLGVTADDFLCPSLLVITKTLHLSQNIAGVTFLAFGNGAPDIFSSIAGTQQDRPELVIGTLFGAGIFVTSVIVGSIIVAKPFKIMERPFLRDIIFYVCAAFWAFLRFYYGEIKLWHSIGFIALYIMYILVVVISRIIYNKFRKKKATVPEISINVPAEEKNKPEGEVNLDERGVEDNPEAMGIVLRRFSFRGSISVQKKRTSSIHSHHDHMINSLRQSVDYQLNPAYTNEEMKSHPSYLDSQHSMTSVSSLLSSTAEKTILRELFTQIFPIDIEAWKENSLVYKAFDIIKAPICFLLILTVPVVDYENEKNNWCKPLNLLHIFTSPLFIIFSLQEYGANIKGVPVWAIVLSASVILAILVYCTSTNTAPPIYHCTYGYVGFATSVIWVYVLASEIVSLLKTIGTIFRLSDTILGLTVLAWGNSIGDFISNLSVARQGYPRMGISACYGGPLLNLLLGIGIPYTIVIVKYGRPLQLRYERLITLLYSTLSLVLISTIVTMTVLRFHAKRYFGFFLIFVYFIFLACAITLETGVI